MAVKKQSFMKGILVIMGAQILVKLMGFAYRVILTNFKEFSDTGNSYYGSGYTVYTFILAIATLGIPNTISKIVSEKIAVGDRRGAHKVFKVAFFLFAFVGAFFAVVLYVFAEPIATYVLANPGVELTMKVLAPAVFFCAVGATVKGYFIGMSNMSLISNAQIIDQIVNCIFSVAFVAMLLNTTPEVMAAGSTMATTLATFSSMMYVLIYYRHSKKDIMEEIDASPKSERIQKRDIVKQIIKYVIPISFGSLVVQLSGLIDLVSVMKGLDGFGYTLDKANEIFRHYFRKSRYTYISSTCR
ncbi:MAG: oligosaccharide flippase family protein [Clostridia bacterium]